MACDIITTRGAVFTLWGKPTVADVERVRVALENAAEECGHPVVYITRIPTTAPPPDAVVRARLNELMPRISEVCSSYHVVLEGDGFSAAIKRGILIGFFQLGWQSKLFFVHATVNEVASNVSLACKPVVRAIVETARVQGLLTRSLPASARDSLSS